MQAWQQAIQPSGTGAAAEDEIDVDLWHDETRTRAGMALIVVDDSEVRYERFWRGWQRLVVAAYASVRHAAAMDQISSTSATLPRTRLTETTEYRCDGCVVARCIIESHSVAACNAAPSDLSAERMPARDTALMY
jgi:hypothetical protein